VLIGKDTRVSGYMLEAALEAGFSAAGVDVMLCGPMPTPAIAYLTRALRLQAGVVISASHNPYDDNGIKFFSAQGTKLPDAVEEAIEARLDAPLACRDSARLGRARRVDDAAGRYIEFCKSTFPNELELRGIKIVVDCAHGAAYHVAPKVFHELGADVVAVGAAPNGLNINDGVGATATASLRRAVLEHRADIGIALDGDGDRVIMADSQGRLYDGDELLYIVARQRHQRSPVAGAVGTLMTNLGFEHALGRLGIPFARAKVGDRYVLEMMQERGWPRTPATSSVWTSTAPVTASSRRCRCWPPWPPMARPWRPPVPTWPCIPRSWSTCACRRASTGRAIRASRVPWPPQKPCWTAMAGYCYGRPAPSPCCG
jgi:phosphoglucosamine mutase